MRLPLVIAILLSIQLHAQSLDNKLNDLSVGNEKILIEINPKIKAKLIEHHKNKGDLDLYFVSDHFVVQQLFSNEQHELVKASVYFTAGQQNVTFRCTTILTRADSNAEWVIKSADCPIDGSLFENQ